MPQDSTPNLHLRVRQQPARIHAVSTMGDAGSPARYEIRIDGVFDAAWFDGLQVYTDGTKTVISGRFADQRRRMDCWPGSATWVPA